MENSTQSTATVATEESIPTIGPALFRRNDYGLIDNIDYKYNEDGTVNWRAMIDPADLVPNREAFTDKSPEELKTLDVSTLPDSKLLILLNGIKKLARLRGYDSVSYELVKLGSEYVVAKCKICFIGNYETSFRPVAFESVANATIDNTNGFGAKFLETIAENRSFVRCVRNFLNIPIVGADEVSKNKADKTPQVETEEKSGNETDPISMIKAKVAELNWSFDELKTALVKSNEDNEKYNLAVDAGKEKGPKKPVLNGVEDWRSYSDIPKEYVFSLISRLSKKARSLKK